MNDKILGETTVSPNHQIALIKQVRPWLDVKPGEKLQYVLTSEGKIIIEKVT